MLHRTMVTTLERLIVEPQARCADATTVIAEFEGRT